MTSFRKRLIEKYGPGADDAVRLALANRAKAVPIPSLAELLADQPNLLLEKYPKNSLGLRNYGGGFNTRKKWT
jgi:hypothetical protein